MGTYDTLKFLLVSTCNVEFQPKIGLFLKPIKCFTSIDFFLSLFFVPRLKSIACNGGGGGRRETKCIGTGKRAQLYYSLSRFFLFIYLLNKRHGRNIVLAKDNESTHTYVNTVRGACVYMCLKFLKVIAENYPPYLSIIIIIIICLENLFYSKNTIIRRR